MTRGIRPTVAVVDYGVGNLFSVARACEAAGLTPLITGDAAAIEPVDAVLLPGVGAFGDAMAALRRQGLDEALVTFARSGKPLVGICLGLQLLLTESEEFGRHRGLGLVPGTVRRLAPNQGAKVPQVGWNRITAPRPGAWAGTALADLAEGTYMYFVHSYVAEPADPASVLATARYGGAAFCAALRYGNVFACQFHPERSGADGLAVYASIARLIVEGASS